MSLNNITYFYKLPPSATETQLTECYPQSGDLEFTVEKEEVRYRLLCATEFVAMGSSYTALKTLLDTDPCDEVTFVIKLAGTEVWAGQLNLKKGRWAPDLGQVVFPVDLQDDYTCLRDSWETEENIFEFGSDTTVEPFFGTLTEVTCGPVNVGGPIELTGFFETNVSGCLADLDAYSYKRLYIEEINPTSYDHYAVWVTEQATVACSGGVPVSPPGTGWVLLNNDCGGSGNATWGRKPQINFVEEQSATTGKYWDQLYEVVGADASVYDNGRLLADILTGLTTDCGYTVKSDFFGINAPGTAPSNSAYTASSAIQDIVVFQKSDIKRPNAAQPATIGYIKLKDLLEYLRNMFQAYWVVEDSGATLRIEHFSYFEGSNGDDLTVTNAAKVANKNGFTFEGGRLAPREQYEWMDETVDSDFRGRDIIYPAGCTDASQEPEVIQVREVFTDLAKCQDDPENVLDEGFFFMATDEISGSYYLNRETGELSGEIRPNVHLSWANLHENYHTWGRLFPSGNLNAQNVTFDSYKRSKKQEQLAVDYSASDFFAMDFADKLNTEIGWGEIASASYSVKNGLLTVDLLHDE